MPDTTTASSTARSETRIDVLIVVSALAAFAIIGLTGVIVLIDRKAESAAIAIVSGLVGTAIGSLSSMLVSTSKATQTPAGTPDAPIATINVNGPNDRVLTSEAPAPSPMPATPPATIVTPSLPNGPAV